MKINNLKITNVLKIASLDMDLSKTAVSLIVGENEAGKSSIRDALQVALTGQARGLKTHADQAYLIKEGEKFGEVVIRLEGGKEIAWRKTPKTPATVSGDLPDNRIIMSILSDPLTFLSLPDKERREILFNLIPGLHPSREEIAKRLREHIPDPNFSLIDISALAETKGFKAAEDSAVESRRVAKRLVKEVTVEDPEPKATIGEREYILPDIQQEQVQSGLDTLRADRDVLLQKRGKVEAQAEKLPELEKQLANLEAEAPDEPEEGEVERHEKSLEVNRGLVTDLEVKIKAMTDGKDPLCWPRVCPVIPFSAVNIEFLCPRAGQEAVPGTKPKTDPASLEKLKAQLAEIQKEVVLIENDLQQAKLAAAVYADYQKQHDSLQAKITKTKEREAQAPEDMAGIENKIKALDARLAIGYELLDAVRDFWRQKEAADAAKEKVAKAEKEIALYDALAKALAPDGIQSQLIAEALGPVNERLAAASGYLFPDNEPLRLTDDLEVYRGATPYALLSKSARYRTGIAFQVVLAQLAEARLLLVDELDILDPLNRANIIEYLLAIHQDFDTIIGFATSDHADPSPIPELQVWWLEGGKVEAVRERRAA